MKKFKFLERSTKERITDYMTYEMDVDVDVDILNNLRERIDRISSSLYLGREMLVHPQVDLSFLELYPQVQRTHYILPELPTPTVTPTMIP